MARAMIYYFSGTGTTAYAAEKIKEKLSLKGIAADIKPLDFIEEWDSGYDIYGFGFPVYAFGSPVPFKKFISQLADGNNKKAFVFSTCGGASGKCEHRESRLLKKKGFQVITAETFAGIANYPVGKVPDNDNIQSFLNNNETKFSEMAEIISQSIYQPLYKGSSIGHLVNKLFSWKGRIAFAKHAQADEKCIKCNRCVEMCPMDNISRVDNQILFGKNCAYCLRCINNCPVNAIRYKNISMENQYRGPLGNYQPPLRKEE